MRRHLMPVLLGCGLFTALPAVAEGDSATPSPSLEIPEVEVVGTEPTAEDLPTIAPSEPKLETEFTPPPAGPSATEQDLSKLDFRTKPDLFAPQPLTARDGRTSLTGSFGRPDWFQLGGWDSRQIGPFHSFVQADFASGSGIVAPWQHGLGRLAAGWQQGDTRFSLAADGDYVSRRGEAAMASQFWGDGRLSVAHPLGDDAMTYRLNWESGAVSTGGVGATTIQPQDTGIHGGDLGARWEPAWGGHRPLLDVGAGFHWAGISAWPVGSVLAADRFQWGPSDWQLGVKYDLVGGDHSLAPAVRAVWRGWPETLVTAAIDGGQQTPFAGSLMRQRPFAQFGNDLRSEYMLAQAHLRVEHRLAKGLVAGVGADLGGIDRKLYWSRAGETPFWQLRNAPGAMLQWGGDAGLRYDLGGVIPFVRYRFQQASSPDPTYPTDGSHDFRLGFEMGFEKFHLETAVRLMLWNLSQASSGRNQGAQPNVLLLDGAAAYDITDTVQAHLRVTDGVLRSSDMLPGYWEPAFTVMGGIGVQF